MRFLFSARRAASALAAVAALGCAESAPLPVDPPSAGLADAAGPAPDVAVPVVLIPRHAPASCLAVGMVASTPRAATLWECTPNERRQHFVLTAAQELRTATNLCLGPSGTGASGESIVAAPCTGAERQRWTYTPLAQFQGLGGKCLDVLSARRQNGARLVLWPCHTKLHQLWDAAPPPSAPAPTAATRVIAPAPAVLLGATVQLTALALDSGGNVLAGRPAAAWATSDSTVVQVSAAGVATGLRAGTATVTATIDGRAGSVALGVTEPPAARVDVAVSAAALAPGQTAQATATPRDSAGRPLTTRVVAWATGDARVAVVSAAGLVTATGGGTTTVTATADGRAGAASVSVAGPRVVTVRPGESIQAAVDANPAGTVFVLAAGTHRRQSVVPKDSNVFRGEPGAVLTGEDVTPFAFRWADGRFPRDVRVERLVIEHYASPKQTAAVLAGWHDRATATSGWVVADCEVRHNAGMGIRIGHRTQLLRNNVHHNGQLGIGGIGDDVLVEGNEIAYNNYRRAFVWGWEAGGTKFVLTNRLVVRNNFSHHNVGPGLWTDIDNRNSLYEGNRVEDNVGPGIMHEISWAAVIRNNVVRRNGFDTPALEWVGGAGIQVVNSADVEVYGNTVEDNHNGIAAQHQNRGGGPYGVYATRNLYVHDNLVRMARGYAGLVDDVGDPNIYATWGNRFVRNTYRVAARTGWDQPFRWRDGFYTGAQWQALGQEAGGQFLGY